MAGQQVSNGFVVTIDGSAAARRHRAACWSRRTWTTTGTCRTCSSCASATPTGSSCPRPAVKIGSRVKIAVTSTDTQQPAAADLGRGHRAGGRVRLDRHVHAGPRLRPVPPAVPWPPHGDLHAGHRVRRRGQGGPAGRSEHRHRRVDHHGLRPRVAGRRQRLAVPQRAGPGDRLRGRGPRRQVRVPHAPPGRRRPGGGRRPAANPLVLELGTDLLRVRSAVTSAEQVKEIQVRGWDIAQKKAIIGTAPAQHDERRAARRGSGRSGAPVRRSDLRRHRRAVPHAGRGRRGRQGRGRADRRRVRRIRRGDPRQPEDAGGHGGLHRQPRVPVRRQVHHHDVAAPLRPDHRLHDPVRGHRPAGAHPARPDLRRRRPPTGGWPAWSSPRSATSTTRRTTAG